MGTFKLAMNDLALVPPLLKSVDDYEIRELGSVDFSYKVMACHVYVHNVDGSHRRMILLQPFESERLVALDFQGNAGRLNINPYAAKKILAAAQHWPAPTRR